MTTLPKLPECGDYPAPCNHDPAHERYGDLYEEEHDPVLKPQHYFHPSGIEVINITKYETFLRGNVLKYVLRAPYKGAELQDLEKAAEYLRLEIERVRNEQES